MLSGKRYHTHTRVRHGSANDPHTRVRDGSLAKLFRLFSRHISGTQSFRENRHVNIHLLVVHNPLVPLIGRLVACSARTRADRQTDRPTTVTLAAHTRRGLIMEYCLLHLCIYSRPCFAEGMLTRQPGRLNMV